MNPLLIIFLIVALAGGLGYEFYTQQKMQQRITLLETDAQTMQSSVNELPRSSDLNEIKKLSTQYQPEINRVNKELGKVNSMIDTLSGRLAQLAQHDQTIGERLNKAAEQLAQLEKKSKALIKPEPAPKPKPEAKAEPKPEEVVQPVARIEAPPFDLLGTEARGEELYVLIAPKGSTSLSQTRLFRVNDNIDGYWRLKAVSEDSAVLVDKHGKVVNMPINGG